MKNPSADVSQRPCIGILFTPDEIKYILKLSINTKEALSAKGQGYNFPVLPPVTHTPVSEPADAVYMFPDNDGISSIPTRFR